MKIRRIASSVALAAALALGATGCGLIAPQSTTEPYAPSDGVEANLQSVQIRNLLLVADESGENFNVVFTGVNNSSSAEIVRMTFVAADGSKASGDFLLPPGLTSFGHPDGEMPPLLVPLSGTKAGATVMSYLEVSSGQSQLEVPVLDGTLVEYREYVISARQLRALEQAAEDARAELEGATEAETQDSGEANGESAEQAQ